MAGEISKIDLKFVKELIEFYRGFVTGSSKSIRILAEIEEKYPKQYRIINEIRWDPESVEKLMEELTDNQKELFFNIFIKASILGQRLNRLFELTIDEKKKLADDLDKFSEEVEKKLTKIIEKPGEE